MKLPQWPSVKSENTMVQYPILAYKSDLPSNDELIICNLVTNSFQKCINLYPYKFVQFV